MATDVNDVELQRARAATKAIEKALIAKDPTINPDKTFANADKVGSSKLRKRPDYRFYSFLAALIREAAK